MNTIFITGASTGIGFETAKLFSKRGWNVAATMRSPEKGNELAQLPHVKIYSLDVSDEASIQDAFENALTDFGAIDVLFNNAGYALIGVFESMTDAQIQKQFETNVFGLMRVTRQFTPYFRARKKGTIINTTSMGGLITFPLYSTYHATKWAVEGFAESLQFELRPFGIRVKNIEPGAINTEFNNATEFVKQEEYLFYTEPAHANMMAAYKNAPFADLVAKEVWKAATDSSFKLRYPVSFQSKILLFMRRIVPQALFFALIRGKLEKGVRFNKK
jgi:NAD(P)-dependent dehydrogenase (short-subunit alcohol dehydrogenase family)